MPEGTEFVVYTAFLMRSAFGALQPTFAKKDLSLFFNAGVHAEHSPGSAIDDWVFDREYVHELQLHKTRKIFIDYVLAEEGLSEQQKLETIYSREVFAGQCAAYLYSRGVTPEQLAAQVQAFVDSRVWASMPAAEELPNSGFAPIPKDTLQLLDTVGVDFMGAGNPYYFNPLVTNLGGPLTEDFTPYTVKANGVAGTTQQGILAKRTRARSFSVAFSLTIRGEDRYYAGIDPVSVDEYRVLLPEVWGYGIRSANIGDSLPVTGDAFAPRIGGYEWGLAVNGGTYYDTPTLALHEIRMRTSAFTFDSAENTVYRPVLVNIGPQVTSFATSEACEAAYVAGVNNMGAVGSNGLWRRADGLPTPLADNSKFMVVQWGESRGACSSLNGQANEGILYTLTSATGLYAKLPDYVYLAGGTPVVSGVSTYAPYYVSEFLVTKEGVVEFSTSAEVQGQTVVTNWYQFDLVTRQRLTVPPQGMTNQEYYKVNPDTLDSVWNGVVTARRYLVNLSDHLQLSPPNDVTHLYSDGGLTYAQILDIIFAATAAIVNPSCVEVTLAEMLILLGGGGLPPGGGGGGGEEDP